jgi:hypothetical protein
VGRTADVGGLDPRAALLQPLELLALGRVPVVGERYRDSGVERQFGQLRSDVPRPEYEEGLRCA